MSPKTTQATIVAFPYRSSNLCELLGIGKAEANDYSIPGRLNLIKKLAAARRAEITRGETGSWLYDVGRHLALTKAARIEIEALGPIVQTCNSPADLTEITRVLSVAA